MTCTQYQKNNVAEERVWNPRNESCPLWDFPAGIYKYKRTSKIPDDEPVQQSRDQNTPKRTKHKFKFQNMSDSVFPYPGAFFLGSLYIACKRSIHPCNELNKNQKSYPSHKLPTILSNLCR